MIFPNHAVVSPTLRVHRHHASRRLTALFRGGSRCRASRQRAVFFQSESVRTLTAAAKEVGDNMTAFKEVSAGSKVVNSSPQVLLEMTPSTVTPGSRALQRAAQEADRLTWKARSVDRLRAGARPSSQAAEAPFKMRNITESVAEKVTASRLDRVADEDSYQRRAGDALNAATALLRISNIQPLADAIFDHSDVEKVAKFHRAFISILSWGLSLTEESAPRSSATCRQTATLLLETLLQVVERAHKLDLPLHMPLYRRVLQQLASYSSCLEEHEPVETIVQVATHAASKFDGADGSGDLRTWLEPLIEPILTHPNIVSVGRHEYFRMKHAARLVEHMSVYDTAAPNQHISVDTVVSVLLAVRTWYRRILGRPGRSPPAFVDDATVIMKWMEPTLVHIHFELSVFFEKHYDLPMSDGVGLLSLLAGRFSGGKYGVYKSFDPHMHKHDVITDSILTGGLTHRGAKDLVSDIVLLLKSEADATTRLAMTANEEEDDEEDDDEEEEQQQEDDSSTATIPTRRSKARECDLVVLPQDADVCPDVLSQLTSWKGHQGPLRYSEEYEMFSEKKFWDDEDPLDWDSEDDDEDDEDFDEDDEDTDDTDD